MTDACVQQPACETPVWMLHNFIGLFHGFFMTDIMTEDRIFLLDSYQDFIVKLRIDVFFFENEIFLHTM